MTLTLCATTSWRSRAMRARSGGPEVGPHDDVRVEQCDQPVEVAVTRSRQERVDELALRLEVDVGNGSLGPYAPARKWIEQAGREPGWK
jgi:hypothetical protein